MIAGKREERRRGGGEGYYQFGLHMYSISLLLSTQFTPCRNVSGGREEGHSRHCTIRSRTPFVEHLVWLRISYHYHGHGHGHGHGHARQTKICGIKNSRKVVVVHDMGSPSNNHFKKFNKKLKH